MITDNLMSFFRAFIINPRGTGAVLPSSKFLAKEMASQVFIDKGIVIELGAGTGVITEALLELGISPDNIIVIEYSVEMVKNLRDRFPHIEILEGDAAYLMTLLKNETRQINTIISSLPLRSLPPYTTQSILQQIDLMLPLGGRYIQFTYGAYHNHYEALLHCDHIFSKRVWRNIPPARVDVWEKKSI